MIKDYDDIDSLKNNPVPPLALPRGAERLAVAGQFTLYEIAREFPLKFQIWSKGIYVAGFKTRAMGLSYLSSRC